MSEPRNDGARLAAWRASLPRSPQNRGMPRTGLSRAAGWSETWWGKLEDMVEWNDHHRQQVARGVRAVAGLLDVSPETVDACVAHILDGAPAPQLGPWLPDRCPAAPMGRPSGARSPRARTSREESDGISRPVLPEPVLREKAGAVLKLLARGELDVSTAERAIFDIFEPLALYYNKLDRPDHTAA